MAERECPRLVAVKMEDGSWESGLLLTEIRDRFGHAAQVRWQGVTSWLYRNRGSGNPNEWREVTPATHETRKSEGERA